MEDVVVPGKVPSAETIEVLADPGPAVRRVTASAKSCLNWHSGQMQNDPEYRAAVRHVAKLLSARPGRLGRAVRDLVAGHSLLRSVL